jgi:hypothetical protein
VPVTKSKAAVAGDDEFDPRVPLAWEKLLVQLDNELLSSLKRNSPDEFRAGLQKLERKIGAEGATVYLDKLCSVGCDRRDLLWLLHPLSKEPIFKDVGSSNKPGIGSIEGLFGISSKDLRRLIKKINELAAQLESVNEQPEFAALLGTHPLYPAWRLPRTLRTYAKLLNYGARHFAANSHIFHNIAKARLTSYIESRSAEPSLERTNYHDEEIATLISAVWGDADLHYDATAHRVWRDKHYRRLRALDPDLDIYGPITHSDSALPSES